MRLFYCFFVVGVSMITMISGYALYKEAGLIIMGFAIVIFILSWFRYELYEQERAKNSK